MNVFILAHILADFVFHQDSNMIEKRNGSIKGILKHILKVAVFFAIAAIIFVIVGEIIKSKILSVITFIGINIFSHFIFDLTKSKLQKQWLNKNFLLLIVDQALHLVILVTSYNLILGDSLTSVFQGDYYIVLLIFLLVTTFVSSVVIREILNIFHLKSEEEIFNTNEKIIKLDADACIVTNTGALSEKTDVEGEAIKANNVMKAGKWIGIIERAIMFLSIYFNLLGLLTIVVAFKTLTRYENIKKNPEYYIIGNLSSILLVLVSYGIFKKFAVI